MAKNIAQLMVDFTLKAVLSWKGDKVVDLAKINLFAEGKKGLVSQIVTKLHPRYRAVRIIRGSGKKSKIF